MLVAHNSALLWVSQGAKNGKEEDVACVALAQRERESEREGEREGEGERG
jgi:hypothetical protein